MRIQLSLALSGLVLSSPALAFDWVEVAPGVRFASEVRPGPINVFVADIDSCAPGVRFRATSPNDGRYPRVTSDFASLVGATVAINGDFFDHDFGMNVGDGAWWGAYGASDGLDSATSGNFAVGDDRIEMFPEEILFPAPEAWMQQVVSGRWTLIRDGQPVYGISDGGFVCSPGLRHPRTTLGQSEDGRHVYLFVADGRGMEGSIGITCDEGIDVMLELGAYRAMGLDSGGSSTMVVDGAVVNHPSDGHERSILNHLGVIADGSGPAPHCGELPAAPTGAAAPGPLVFSGAPGGFEPVTPYRVFDTRTSAAVLGGVTLDADGRVVGGTSFDVDRFSLGAPTDASALLFGLTATDPQSAGYATVTPSGSALPTASNLNYGAGETVPNAVASALDAGGVSIFTFATTHLIADVQGWFVPGGAGLQPVDPERVLDTRQTGQRLAAGATMQVLEPLVGGATAATLNVTAVSPSAPGFVTLYPCDEPLPVASHLNYVAGQVVAGSVSIDGTAGVCAYSLSETDLVVDLDGVWTPGDGLQLQPVEPLRVLDTRDGSTAWSGRVQADQGIELELDGISGFPADAGAVALNVTVTQPTRDGFLTVYPCSAAVPEVSNLNYSPGRTVANLVLVDLSDDGSVCLTSSASTHLVVDLDGVFVGQAAPDAEADDYVVYAPLPGACATVEPASAAGLPALLALALLRRR